MSKTIYELYQEHPEKHIPKKVIEEMFDLLLEDDLKPYVKDFKVSDKFSLDQATYDLQSRVITINRDVIEEENYFGKFPKSLQMIRAMKHELEHAKSLKALEEGRDNLRSITSMYAYKDFAIQNGIIQPEGLSQIDYLSLYWKIKENKEFSPAERIAEIAAWKYLVNLLKNQRTTRELLISRRMLYNSYTMGYHNNRYYLEAPTLRFLLNTRMLQDYYLLKKRIEKKDYSLDTRLLYGLPVTQKEYDKKILEKVKLQKRAND